jgi:hypothetical protein
LEPTKGETGGRFLQMLWRIAAAPGVLLILLAVYVALIGVDATTSAFDETETTTRQRALPGLVFAPLGLAILRGSLKRDLGLMWFGSITATLIGTVLLFSLGLVPPALGLVACLLSAVVGIARFASRRLA